MLRILLVFGFAIFAAGSHETHRRGLNRNSDFVGLHRANRYDVYNNNPNYYGNYNLNAYVSPANNNNNINPDNNNKMGPDDININSNTGGNSNSGNSDTNRVVDVLYYSFQSSGDPIISSTPSLDFQKDVYILVPGVSDTQNQPYYLNEYFGYLSDALMYFCDNKCTVTAFHWSAVYDYNDLNNLTKAAVEAGKIFEQFLMKIPKSKRLTLIGHDLGNVVISSASTKAKTNAYVFGLDQRKLPRGFEQYYLRREMFELLQTLNKDTQRKEDFFEYDYGHRNFHFRVTHWNATNTTSNNFPDYNPLVVKGYCYKCDSYRLLADDIVKKGFGHPASFCSDFENFIKGICSRYPLVSFFNTKTPTDIPNGRYFSWEGVL